MVLALNPWEQKVLGGKAGIGRCASKLSTWNLNMWGHSYRPGWVWNGYPEMVGWVGNTGKLWLKQGLGCEKSSERPVSGLCSDVRSQNGQETRTWWLKPRMGWVMIWKVFWSVYKIHGMAANKISAGKIIKHEIQMRVTKCEIIQSLFCQEDWTAE